MAADGELGSRLLIAQIDGYTVKEPSRAWMVFPVDDTDLGQGFRDITYQDFSNAINVTAQWLQDNLPPAVASFETLAYIGPNDARCPIIAVATAKIEKKLLLVSPWATRSTQAHLLNESDCRVFLHAATFKSVVEEILPESAPGAAIPLEVPNLSDILWKEPTSLVPYSKSWSEGKDDPWLIFHTSGTTAVPKLITYTHDMMASLDAAELMPDAHEENMNHHFRNRRWYTPLPCLHYAGMSMALQPPVFLGSTIVMGPSNTGPTQPSIAKQVMDYAKVQGALLPPSLIDSMIENPDELECLRNLDIIHFAGAPLSRRCAEKLQGHVILKSAIGSTEAGPYFVRYTDHDDLEYCSFRSATGLEFQHVAGNLYEAVFVKKPGQERWQQVFKIYPELNVFHTKDVFAEHHSKPGTWKYIGRADDVIVFAHGEKLHVTALETEIADAHPMISAALIGGQGRTEPYLLVEWKETDMDEKTKFEQLIPIIDHANRHCLDLAKLSLERTFFTHTDKPLVRTFKGSISRQESEKQYLDRIEDIYHG